MLTEPIQSRHPGADPEVGTPAGSDRIIRRRRELPNGRAVVGGLLITVAVVGTFAAYRDGGGAPTTTYVVVTDPIDAGDRIEPAAVAVEPIELPATVADQAFTSVGQLDGAVALAPLRSGQLLQRADVLAAGAPGGSLDATGHELSLSIPRDRAVDGTLNRGERVDLLATYDGPDGAATWVVARSALVTGVDNEPDTSLASSGEVTVTLALGAADAVLRVTHARDTASVTVVRTTRAADDEPGPDHFAGPGR